jgi:hypothetical protein
LLRKPQRFIGWAQQIDDDLAQGKELIFGRDEWRRLMREAKARKGL